MMKIPKFKLRLIINEYSKKNLHQVKKKLLENSFIIFVKVFSSERSEYITNGIECILDIYTPKGITLKKILFYYQHIYWKYEDIGYVFFEKDGIYCVFKDEHAYYIKKNNEKVDFLNKNIYLAHFYSFPIAVN